MWEGREMTEINKIDPLDGRNYRSWKYNIRLVLMERGLWKIAEGSETKPETNDDKVKKAWELRSDKAYSLIKCQQRHTSSSYQYN